VGDRGLTSRAGNDNRKTHNRDTRVPETFSGTTSQTLPRPGVGSGEDVFTTPIFIYALNDRFPSEIIFTDPGGQIIARRPSFFRRKNSRMETSRACPRPDTHA